VIDEEIRRTTGGEETVPVFDESIPHNMLTARLLFDISEKPSVDFIDAPHCAVAEVSFDVAGFCWRHGRPALTWTGIVKYGSDDTVVEKQARHAQQLPGKTILAAPNSDALHRALNTVYRAVTAENTQPDFAEVEPDYAEYYRVGQLNEQTLPSEHVPVDEVATNRSLVEHIAIDADTVWEVPDDA
jgi:hypothetical protein